MVDSNGFDLWHSRLGHVHYKRMEDMSKDGLIPDISDPKEGKCTRYMLTKITHLSFRRVEREESVLGLVHSDLRDLHATPSLGMKKYYVTYIDDFSRFCYAYLVHAKSHALDRSITYKMEVE